MSQQAHRPAPPTADATTDRPGSVAADAVADLPAPGTANAVAPRPEPRDAEMFPPFSELLEAMRSPAANRSDIDAFIAAMGRPPTADEQPRARADELLALMARDNPLGDYKGRDGTKVRHAAKSALLALGYPYALELPPELLDSPRPRARSRPYTGPGVEGVIASLVSALYQTGLVAVMHLFLGIWSRDALNPLAGFFIPALLATWIPTLCALIGFGTGQRTLHRIGSWGQWLLMAVWALASLSSIPTWGPVLLSILPWHVTLWAALAMRPGPEPTTPAPQPASKP
ncbi:MAG: hypothetical protein EOO71_30240 [Myxococcaceae bacterium]|nr:MAG: hypothetical protein EOO71_30240 [Myxococcaceae bacterium]